MSAGMEYVDQNELRRKLEYERQGERRAIKKGPLKRGPGGGGEKLLTETVADMTHALAEQLQFGEGARDARWNHFWDQLTLLIQQRDSWNRLFDTTEDE